MFKCRDNLMPWTYNYGALEEEDQISFSYQFKPTAIG